MSVEHHDLLHELPELKEELNDNSAPQSLPSGKAPSSLDGEVTGVIEETSRPEGLDQPADIEVSTEIDPP